jgi:DNA-binding MarR family transcriptional regulator
MPTAADRLANVLGATALALTDRMLGPGAVNALPSPVDHPSAVATLALLNWVPKMPQGRLSYCLGLSQPATVRLVDRLEDAGLVRRARVHRRRQIWVEATEAGLGIARRYAAYRSDAMKTIVTALAPRDRTTFSRLLEHLASLLLDGKEHVMRVCRLCDARACGTDDDCPMWRAARVLP